MQRVDFNLGFYEYLGGLKPIRRVRHWGAPAHDQRERYRCLEPLSAPEGLGTVTEYHRLREYTRGPVKMPVPGPFTLAGRIEGGEVYRSQRRDRGPDSDRQRRAHGPRGGGRRFRPA
jgi:5-methyltetrahydropteroyltriglutamate--homocysteine methyltransferase